MANLSDPSILNAVVGMFVVAVIFIGGVVGLLWWFAKQPLSKKYKCSNCGLKFNTEKAVKEHLEGHKYGGTWQEVAK